MHGPLRGESECRGTLALLTIKSIPAEKAIVNGNKKKTSIITGIGTPTHNCVSNQSSLQHSVISGVRP